MMQIVAANNEKFAAKVENPASVDEGTGRNDFEQVLINEQQAGSRENRPTAEHVSRPTSSTRKQAEQPENPSTKQRENTSTKQGDKAQVVDEKAPKHCEGDDVNSKSELVESDNTQSDQSGTDDIAIQADSESGEDVLMSAQDLAHLALKVSEQAEQEPTVLPDWLALLTQSQDQIAYLQQSGEELPDEPSIDDLLLQLQNDDSIKLDKSLQALLARLNQFDNTSEDTAAQSDAESIVELVQDINDLINWLSQQTPEIEGESQQPIAAFIQQLGELLAKPAESDSKQDGRIQALLNQLMAKTDTNRQHGADELHVGGEDFSALLEVVKALPVNDQAALLESLKRQFNLNRQDIPSQQQLSLPLASEGVKLVELAEQPAQLKQMLHTLLPDVPAQQRDSLAQQWQQLSREISKQPDTALESFVALIQPLSGQSTDSQELLSQLQQLLPVTSPVNDLAQHLGKQLHSALQLHPINHASAASAVTQHELFNTQLQDVMRHEGQATNLTKAEGLQHLTNQVQMMVNQKLMTADIRLDPPELGSMQARVQLNGDQASVSFVVQTQTARDMLQDSQQRLRDMLAERGIELNQSSIRQQSDQSANGQNGQGQQAGQGQQFANGENIENIGQSELVSVSMPENGVIDYFV